jgi:hypothetical protein
MNEHPPQDNQTPQEPQKPFNDPPKQPYPQQPYPQQLPNEPWQPWPNTFYPPQQPYPPQPGWEPAPQYPQAPFPQYPPPPPPPKKRLGPLFWILVIGGTLLVCAACSGIGIAISRSSTTASTVTQATPSLVVTQSTDTPTPPPSSSDVHFKIGEAANTPDGYTVMVNKVYTSPGDEFNTPQSGNQYLVVDASVRNNTGQNQLMASNQFTLTDNTGQRIDDTIASLPNVHAYVGGTLSNGKTMRGQLVYEVPKGNHPYELAFAANTIFSNYQIVWDIHS